MTREQHQAARELLEAELKWLFAYGWQPSPFGQRVWHRAAPKGHVDYTVSDAMALTRAEPLRYTVWERGVLKSTTDCR